MTTTRDGFAFFKAWLKEPRRVGAVAPSSKRLAALITGSVDPCGGAVLELGAGTGVFTRALIERGVPEEYLTLVEFGYEFAQMLKERYPAATIVCRDAARLAPLRPKMQLHHAAVSGLPLLSMPPGKVLRILNGAFALLEVDASLFQFTYGWRCPVPEMVLNRLDLRAERIGTVIANVPPASVYRLSRQH